MLNGRPQVQKDLPVHFWLVQDTSRSQLPSSLESGQADKVDLPLKIAFDPARKMDRREGGDRDVPGDHIHVKMKAGKITIAFLFQPGHKKLGDLGPQLILQFYAVSPDAFIQLIGKDPIEIHVKYVFKNVKYINFHQKVFIPE